VRATLPRALLGLFLMGDRGRGEADRVGRAHAARIVSSARSSVTSGMTRARLAGPS